MAAAFRVAAFASLVKQHGVWQPHPAAAAECFIVQLFLFLSVGFLTLSGLGTVLFLLTRFAEFGRKPGDCQVSARRSL